MAEGDSDDRERTESPTPKRLEEARKKGQVPRSRDLTAAAVVLAGGVGMSSLGALVGGRLLSLMRDGLTLSGGQSVDTGWMLRQAERGGLQGLLAAAPILGVLLAATVLAPMAIGGWAFSTEALLPDFGRLNPVSGLGRVFSVRGLIELSKTLARVVVCGIVATIILRKQFHSFSGLGAESTQSAISHSLSMIGSALIGMGGALAFIALIDVPLAIWQYNKGLRMSREEIREESKQTEGSPEIKGRVRRVQQALARRRMMQEVPKADVVVTNPTHYAVALRYDDKKMRAPIVVAKGQDLIALRIREIATAHKVAIVEAPPLARALHAHCELGDEIPSRLYAAVARVLTYVFHLKTVRRYGGPIPPTPVIEVPEE